MFEKQYDMQKLIFIITYYHLTDKAVIPSGWKRRVKEQVKHLSFHQMHYRPSGEYSILCCTNI